MSIFKQKALSPQEIQLLRLHNQQEGRVVFTEEDLQGLSKENGSSLKVYYKAEKVLDEHKKRMAMAPSRNEMIQICIPRWELQQLLDKNINPVLNEYIALRELLAEKGIITNEEVDAMVDKRLQMERDRQIGIIKQSIEEMQKLENATPQQKQTLEALKVQLEAMIAITYPKIPEAPEDNPDNVVPITKDELGVQDSAEAEVEKHEE